MVRNVTFHSAVILFLAAAFSSSSWAATTQTRNTKPVTVPAPGLLSSNLGLTTTPVVVAQFRGSNTLTGTTALGATVTINADGSYTYDPRTSTVLQTLAPGASMQDTFDYTLAPQITPLGGTTKAFANAPEAKDYTLVYELAIPTAASFNGGTIPYTVDKSSTPYPFTRIAYYLELQTAGGQLQYAYVSMDPFSTDLTKLGVPAKQTNAYFQQFVTNMNVISNAGIVQGTNIATGNIEFWHNDYGGGNTNVPNAAGNFDFGDSRSGDLNTNYGSMQIHNYDIDGAGAGTSGQTVFAYNHWGAAGGGAGDIGIGTNTATGGNNNPDWTFSNNAGSYTVKNLQVLVKPVTATGTVTIQVSNNGLSVANVTQNEGNTGTSNFPFVVTLSQPSNDPVTVTYVTSNGTAVAGSDYVSTTGTVTIPANQTTATINIPVIGDADLELDENFYVVLSNPINAVITGSQAFATILNDDPVPAVSIGNLSKAEGNNATTTTFALPVTLNHLSYQNVTVTFNTANGTATLADNDYVAVTGGSVTIPAGSLSGVANVTVNGDINIEADETFTVTLSAPVTPLSELPPPPAPSSTTTSRPSRTTTSSPRASISPSSFPRAASSPTTPIPTRRPPRSPPSSSRRRPPARSH